MRPEPLPVPPAPTQLVESEGVAEPIAEPKAAKPRKAGAAKGKAKTENAKDSAKDNAKSKEPKAAAANAKVPKVKSSKRKEKPGRK